MAAVLVAAVVMGGQASAQSAGAAPNEPDWGVGLNLNTYILTDETYLQPAVTADREWLHLEARFNYEDRDTASAWLGYSFGAEKVVTLELTPMVGAVFGNTSGMAPGYRATVGWRWLELYSESEYVFDFNDSADNFLYTWSELGVSPAEWWRVGLVVQRTKTYQTAFDIQRGFLAGIAYKRATATAYLFDLDTDRSTVVIGVTVDF